jgi:hypothetical protein
VCELTTEAMAGGVADAKRRAVVPGEHVNSDCAELVFFAARNAVLDLLDHFCGHFGHVFVYVYESWHFLLLSCLLLTRRLQ